MLREMVRREWVAILASQVLRALLLIPEQLKTMQLCPTPSPSKDAVCRPNRRQKIQSLCSLLMDSLLWNLSTGRLMPLTLLKSLADFHREVKSIFGFFSVEAKGQVLTFCQVAEYV